MKENTVYILECADGSYNTGITSDIEQRLHDHEEGVDPRGYTYRRRPVKLVYSDIFPDVGDAILHEKQIKGWRREKKIALIEGRISFLPSLAVNYSKRKLS